MQLTDVAQLSTQSQTPAGSFQAHGQGLSVEDAAAGVARPARPRKIGGGRAIRGCHHAGHQGGPRSGSSARLGRPSEGVVVLDVPVMAGDRPSTSIGGGPHVGAGERRLEEGPAGSNLASTALIAAHGGTARGRGRGWDRARRRGRGDPTRDRWRRLDDRDQPFRPGQAGTRCSGRSSRGTSAGASSSRAGGSSARPKGSSNARGGRGR